MNPTQREENEAEGAPSRSLADLTTGQRARLRTVTGERAWRLRLLEMGFVPGTEVRLVRRLEVGDVLELELRASRISLRISEARALLVDPEGEAGS